MPPPYRRPHVLLYQSVDPTSLPRHLIIPVCCHQVKQLMQDFQFKAETCSLLVFWFQQRKACLLFCDLVLAPVGDPACGAMCCHQVKQLMQDPQFKAEMRRFTEDPAFKRAMSAAQEQSQELMNDPKKVSSGGTFENEPSFS
jgi:hypothetical protein